MANLYDLKKFDLNLLVIFECIYQHLSISKAAETLYITPSAVSQSLQRLRIQLNDPLFIRSGKGITPTTVGNNLHFHLEQNLNQIEKTINVMHGSELTKKIVIYTPQLVSHSVLLDTIKMIASEESYEIELRDLLLTTESAEDLLAYRKADLVFTLSPVNNRSIVSSFFYSLSPVLVCRQDHPRLSDNPTNEELLNERFTRFTTQNKAVLEFRSESSMKLPDRCFAFSSDSLMSILHIISATDFVGFLPQSTFETYKELLNLKSVSAPFTVPPINIFMLYNRSALNSTVFAKFVNQLNNE
ncbi:DNA-binding transcriptional repressor CitR [Pseudenterobacter timonensis]|uniref:DNA-binding transcriptional repressor CitR n=1 Tax=Pseudenterobacter timonensis TaxID=1755099 RepID=UPI00077B742C|nr:LysR family transcriptional regulator [Pseudenterobacter timonensis]